jgi:uncharacterized protein
MENGAKRITIRISKLSEGVHNYHFTAEPETLGLDGAFHGPVEIEVELDKSNRQFYLSAEIGTMGDFTCDRCVTEFSRKIESRFAMLYVHDEHDAGKFPEDEVRLINPNEPELDLTDDLRQSVELAVPLKLLCTEECKGLCPRCGANWNERACECADETSDERWNTLKELLKK